jgi:hypothetical protein
MESHLRRGPVAGDKDVQDEFAERAFEILFMLLDWIEATVNYTIFIHDYQSFHICEE